MVVNQSKLIYGVVNAPVEGMDLSFLEQEDLYPPSCTSLSFQEIKSALYLKSFSVIISP